MGWKNVVLMSKLIKRRWTGCTIAKHLFSKMFLSSRSSGIKLSGTEWYPFFLIKVHPQADKCYTWSSPIEGSTKRRYYAVLYIPPIDSPEKAVRASIVHDHKVEKLK
jgi:hypothetical protein